MERICKNCKYYESYRSIYERLSHNTVFVHTEELSACEYCMVLHNINKEGYNMYIGYGEIGTYYDRKIVAVYIQVENSTWMQPMYQTSGKNGKQKGSWSPFLGCICDEEMYWVHTWFVKKCIVPLHFVEYDILYEPHKWERILGLYSQQKQKIYLQQHAFYPKRGNIECIDNQDYLDEEYCQAKNAHWGFDFYRTISDYLQTQNIECSHIFEKDCPQDINSALYDAEVGFLQ